jgi:hypothetical protein
VPSAIASRIFTRVPPPMRIGATLTDDPFHRVSVPLVILEGMVYSTRRVNCNHAVAALNGRRVHKR